MGNRLFVDLDGTCAKWQPVAEEELFEKGITGIFRSIKT